MFKSMKAKILLCKIHDSSSKILMSKKSKNIHTNNKNNLKKSIIKTEANNIQNKNS